MRSEEEARRELSEGGGGEGEDGDNDDDGIGFGRKSSGRAADMIRGRASLGHGDINSRQLAPQRRSESHGGGAEGFILSPSALSATQPGGVGLLITSPTGMSINARGRTSSLAAIGDVHQLATDGPSSASVSPARPRRRTREGVRRTTSNGSMGDVGGGGRRRRTTGEGGSVGGPCSW